MERRPAAILVADIAGYCRLVEQDEEGVLQRQKRHRRELIDPRIAERGGRIVKTTGDGVLVEFASPQDAVRSAIAIQTAMTERERASPPDRRIVYRVGINYGDVLVDEGDVYGDGVNVAARLQTLAEPGGVCISDSVHQALAGGSGTPFRDLGRQRVRNISRPIRVWQWTQGGAAAEPERDRALDLVGVPAEGRRAVLAAVAGADYFTPADEIGAHCYRCIMQYLEQGAAMHAHAPGSFTASRDRPALSQTRVRSPLAKS